MGFKVALPAAPSEACPMSTIPSTSSGSLGRRPARRAHSRMMAARVARANSVVSALKVWGLPSVAIWTSPTSSPSSSDGRYVRLWLVLWAMAWTTAMVASRWSAVVAPPSSDTASTTVSSTCWSASAMAAPESARPVAGRTGSRARTAMARARTRSTLRSSAAKCSRCCRYARAPWGAAAVTGSCASRRARPPWGSWTVTQILRSPGDVTNGTCTNAAASPAAAPCNTNGQAACVVGSLYSNRYERRAAEALAEESGSSQSGACRRMTLPPGAVSSGATSDTLDNVKRPPAGGWLTGTVYQATPRCRSVVPTMSCAVRGPCQGERGQTTRLGPSAPRGTMSGRREISVPLSHTRQRYSLTVVVLGATTEDHSFSTSSACRQAAASADAVHCTCTRGASVATTATCTAALAARAPFETCTVKR
mmetsp:Transcript_21141/g.37869  ORF Transcript_21141/g.37869 Transcript_21141/m.37869 type:complete len:422 (-) Transcript_21141:654-1919(-)